MQTKKKDELLSFEKGYLHIEEVKVSSKTIQGVNWVDITHKITENYPNQYTKARTLTHAYTAPRRIQRRVRKHLLRELLEVELSRIAKSIKPPKRTYSKRYPIPHSTQPYLVKDKGLTKDMFLDRG